MLPSFPQSFVPFGSLPGNVSNNGQNMNRTDSPFRPSIVEINQNFPANKNIFKVSNKSTRKRTKTLFKLTIFSGIFIVNVMLG